MYPTNYRRPKTLDEAKRMFAEGESAAFLSGGHTLLPAMKLRLASPSDLIDLGAIPELRGVRLEGRSLVIGAMTVHADVAASALVQRHIPALAGLAGSIGDRHVRHRGTIGGSVSNNDPAADYPSAVLGLGATVVTDRRRIGADQFFTGLYQTAREPDEIVTGFDFPVPDIAGYAKFLSPASRFSIAGVFIARTGKGVRVAVTGAGSGGVFRATNLEAALAADFRAEALASCRIDPSAMMADQNGTREYRAHLVMVMARRAMENLGRASVFK
jgi:aerobic carbon-monoxide dehydrogenase medium subunit